MAIDQAMDLGETGRFPVVCGSRVDYWIHVATSAARNGNPRPGTSNTSLIEPQVVLRQHTTTAWRDLHEVLEAATDPMAESGRF